MYETIVTCKSGRIVVINTLVPTTNSEVISLVWNTYGEKTKFIERKENKQ